MNPQSFTIVGLTHRTVSAALRDAVTVADDQRPAFVAALKEEGVTEVLALFTGGRVEVWGVSDNPSGMAEVVCAHLARHAQVTAPALRGNLSVRSGQAAVVHAFTVAASLDSVVLGDPQLIPQIHAAKAVAERAGTWGDSLAPVVDAALRVAERVRTETAIGDGPVSIAAAAVALAQDIHGDLRRSQSLLIGGEAMGTLVAEALQQAGLRGLTVTTPNPDHAESLARSLDAHRGGFDALPGLLAEADIVIAALGDRTVTITVPQIRETLRVRRQRPIYLVDTAIPGDIDPAVNTINNVFLYDLSDLEKLVQAGRSTREQAARAATALVDAEVLAFCKGGGCCGGEQHPATVPPLWESLRQAVLKDHGGDAAMATKVLLERIVAAQATKE